MTASKERANRKNTIRTLFRIKRHYKFSLLNQARILQKHKVQGVGHDRAHTLSMQHMTT